MDRRVERRRDRLEVRLGGVDGNNLTVKAFEMDDDGGGT